MRLLDALRARIGAMQAPEAEAVPAVPVHAVGDPPPSAADLVARFEGFRAAPYLCPAGVPTIGYGTTRYPSGRAVTMQDPPCTEPQARAWLAHALDGAEATVRRYVRTPLTPGQRAALASFVYNVGAGAFASSTLLLRLQAGDMAGAAAEFGRWTRSGGRELPGLVARRAAERAAFVA